MYGIDAFTHINLGLNSTTGEPGYPMAYVTIGGGQDNIASSNYATVGGGRSNTASGDYATVPGGLLNDAGGLLSFAAGHRAIANHDGTFVWADITDANFSSTEPNQFLIRASGGVGIGTNSPSSKLEVTGTSGAPIILGTNIGAGLGIKGESISGNGVAGWTDAHDKSGVHGWSNSGIGVTGRSDNSNGVDGWTGNPNKSGVHGWSNDGVGITGRSNGNNNGIFGVTFSIDPNRAGVFGRNNGTGPGVRGEATDIGVAGEADDYGGYFMARRSTGVSCTGLYGEAAGTSFAYGVVGIATYSGIVRNYGGYFGAAGSMGVGVRGNASGSSSTGVYGDGEAYDFYAGNTSSTDYGSASSIRWKSDIRPIDEPLEKIMNLRGVYFNWDTEHGGQHDVGMIAEEVGEVLPEIVEYEENGVDAIGMDYSKVTPLLVEAVKELKGENDRLKERVKALERTIHQLAKVKELEL
jgi:hypothetical protein